MTNSHAEILQSRKKNMKSLIKIENDFHHTSASTYAEVLWHGIYSEISLEDSQMIRVKKKLCGMVDCTCGGIRGPQKFRGKKLIVNIFPR